MPNNSLMISDNAVAICEDKAFFFGGQTTKGYLNDISCFDLGISHRLSQMTV
jgi:hypothetical protein